MHVFWRAENDEPFSYAGCGRASNVKDTSPVELDWVFDPIALDSGYTSADEVPNIAFREGSVGEVTINAFERSPTARQACIAHWGSRCIVCGLSFDERYGELGQGFIHVHHLIPLAAVSGTYEVDPVIDLRPVCPNCHAMLHRKDPPLAIDELRALLRA